MLFNNMQEKLKEINEFLNQREKEKPNKSALKEELKKLGVFRKLSPLTANELQTLSQNKGIVGVDGSYISIGNTYPHILFFAQALAKATNVNDNGVRVSDIFYGLTNNDNETTMTSEFSKKVTAMEVSVAIEALQKYNPFIVMFDGGFWRLSQDATEAWESYKNLSIEQNVLSVGVIEDAGSYELYDDLAQFIKLPHFMTDAEILFGLLEYGEVLEVHKPFKNQYKKVFARFSNDPLPIACDFLPEQEDRITDILRLIFTLTPKDGRGVPVWIDIVDNEVKITKNEIDLLVESYIDKAIHEKFFIGKRNRR